MFVLLLDIALDSGYMGRKIANPFLYSVAVLDSREAVRRRYRRDVKKVICLAPVSIPASDRSGL
jgi:hypothetical protein